MERLEYEDRSSGWKCGRIRITAHLRGEDTAGFSEDEEVGWMNGWVCMDEGENAQFG